MDIYRLRKDLGYNRDKFAWKVGILLDELVRLERCEEMPSLQVKQQVKDYCDRNNIDFTKYELSNIVAHLVRMWR